VYWLNVLDLFSGLKGWSQAFEDRGHTVVTVDIDEKFNPTICQDIMTLETMDFRRFGYFDIILASPPCNCFSVASIGKHWKNGKPDEETRNAIRLVSHTLGLILELLPRWWILENPRGMLRRVLGKPCITTYFASWGEMNLKPTDLWGVLPENVQWARPMKWQKASRGSRTGTQGKKNAELRAKIPYGLSMAICMTCEKELNEKSS